MATCIPHTHSRHITLQNFYKVPAITIDVVLNRILDANLLPEGKLPSIDMLEDYYNLPQTKKMSREEAMKLRNRFKNPLIELQMLDSGLHRDFPEAITVTYKRKVDLPNLKKIAEDIKQVEKEIVDIDKEANVSVVDGDVTVAYQKNSDGYIPDEQLDSRIKLFLNKLGVQVNSLDGVKNKEGYEIRDAVARAKFVRENMSLIIDIAENKRGLDTLSEEAAHILVWTLRGTPLYNSMMNDITKMSIYQQVREEYADKYTSDIEFKEEAIAKQITASVVRQYTNGADLTSSEFSKLNEEYNRMSRWLNRVINWFRDLLSKYKTNSFDYAAMKILFADVSNTSVNNIGNSTSAYQLEPNDKSKEIISKIQTLADRVRERRIVANKIIDPVTKDEINQYKENDFVYRTSVTRWVKGNKKLTRTELQKAEDTVKKDFGVSAHEYFKNAVLNSIDRLVYDRKPADVKGGELLSTKDKNAIQTYADNLIASYPEGTQFFVEYSIGDKAKDRAGTPDLFIIYPGANGVMLDIFDWKFTEFRKENGKVIVDEMIAAKKKDYLKQLEEYRRILKENYGISAEGRTRIIPISTNIKTEFDNNTKKPKAWKIVGIEISDEGVSGFSEDKKYLNPIPSETERTGIAYVDKAIEGLKLERERLEKLKEKDPAARITTYNRIQNITKTIKELILTKDLKYFIDNAVAELNTIGHEKDVDKLIQASKSIEFYASINLAEYIRELDKEDYDKVASRIESFRNLIGLSSLEVQEKIKQRVLEIANETNTRGFEDAHKDIGIWQKMMSSFSVQQHPKIQALYKLVIGAKEKAKQDLDKTANQIELLVKGVKEYATENNIPLEKAFDFMLTKDKSGNLRLIKKFSKEATDKIVEAKERKDYNYLSKVYKFDKAKYDKAYEANKKYWEVVFKDSENRDKKVKEKTDLFEKQYNVEKYSFAYATEKNYYLTFNEEAVEYSQEYNKIQNNVKLKAFYNYFTEFTKNSREDLGLDFDGSFVPQIMASMTEQISNVGLGAVAGLKDRFYSEVGASYNGNYGEINPLTGKADFTIPLPFTNKIGANASTDLGKVLGMWAMAYYNNKHLKEVETSALLLQESLKSEKFYVTKINGEIAEKDGVALTKNALESNTLAAYIDFMNESVYGINVKKDKAITVKRKRPVLDSEGKYVKNEDGTTKMEEYDYEVSSVKVFNKVLQYISTKALSFNLISASANVFGGVSNGIAEGARGQFYTKSQFMKGMAVFTSGKINPQVLAAVKYFDIMGDMEGYNKTNNLSIREAEKFFTYDKMYLLQKKGDTLVNNTILLALMQNHGVNSEGKIVKITDENKDSIKSIYSSLKIEGDNLVIPGLTDAKDNIEYLKFRRKALELSKKIMGNAPTYDIRTINQTVVGKMFMQFRNWMPRMAEERFGGVRYNQNLEALEEGRYNTFAKFLFNKGIIGNAMEIIKLTTGVGSKDSFDSIASRKFDSLNQTDRNFLIQAAEGDVELARQQYIDLQRANLKGAMMELSVMLTVALTIMLIKGGDDDDEDKNGIKAVVLKTMDRFSNEITFFVNPISFNTVMKSPFAATSLAVDVVNFTHHLFGQGYGTLIGSEEAQNKYKPIKYAGKLFPITTELVRNLTVYNGETYWEEEK